MHDDEMCATKLHDRVQMQKMEVQKSIEWNKAYDSFGGKAKQMMRGESRYGRCKTRSLDKEPVRNGKENVRMLMLVVLVYSVCCCSIVSVSVCDRERVMQRWC